MDLILNPMQTQSITNRWKKIEFVNKQKREKVFRTNYFPIGAAKLVRKFGVSEI